MDKQIPLPNQKYQVILADPPWSYRGQVQHGGQDKPFTSSAASYYNTMSIDELCKLPVKELRHEDGCALFLWFTAPILEDAMRLMSAWGFEYKTIAFVWDKERVNPGAHTMSQCEFVAIGTYKKRPAPLGARNVRQLIRSPRTKHSKKPDECNERIAQMYPTQSKLELFARRPLEGWDVWGNDVK